MKKFFNSMLLIVGTIILYFGFGLNAVKLLLFLIPQVIGLSESAKSNSLIQFMFLFPSYILAGLLVERFMFKYVITRIVKAEDKKDKTTDERKSIQWTRTVRRTLFVAVIISYILNVQGFINLLQGKSLP